MSLYKQPKSRYWWFQIRRKDGTKIRKSTETTDKEKAAFVERTFKMALKREEPVERLIESLRTLYGAKEQGAVELAQVWQIYDQWLTAASKSLERNTLRKRESAVRRFEDWVNANYPAAKNLKNVDRATATAFAEYLAKQGTKGKTRQNIIGDLATVWEALRRARDGITNPLPLVRPDADDSERGQAYTRDQEQALLKAAAQKGKGWWLACMIARHTGLRYGSVATLEWSEIDFSKEVFRHTPRKTKRHNIEVVVPIVEPLLTALKAARSKDPEKTYVLPIHQKVYPRTHASNGPGLFSTVLKAAKIEGDYTFHSWRHTFRTRLSEAGVSDNTAKRLGGWTADATAARYDHAERIEEMRSALVKALKENPNQ